MDNRFLWIHTHWQRWLTFQISQCLRISTSDFLTFAYFLCRSLAFTELNDHRPFGWITNLPLFHELYHVFNLQHVANYSVFLPSPFHQIPELMLWKATNLKEIRKAVWSLSSHQHASSHRSKWWLTHFIIICNLSLYIPNRSPVLQAIQMEENSWTVPFLFHLLNMDTKLWIKVKSGVFSLKFESWVKCEVTVIIL